MGQKEPGPPWEIKSLLKDCPLLKFKKTQPLENILLQKSPVPPNIWEGGSYPALIYNLNFHAFTIIR